MANHRGGERRSISSLLEHVARLLPPLVLLAFCLPARGLEMSVMLTNDDGVKDLKDRVLPLAERLRELADVYVVIPWQDRSGSSNFVSSIRSGRLEVEHRIDEERSGSRGTLDVYVVRGYPADCVALALGGLLDVRPDLVISGINGSPNLADSWLYSGTIGAARMAAHLGVAAMAVSGIDEEGIEGAIGPVTAWVAQLARHELVLGQGAGEYLTVALPPVAPGLIVGVDVAPRDGHVSTFRFEASGENHGRRVWSLAGDNVAEPEPGSDLALVRAGRIVLTPMRVGGDSEPLLETWRSRSATLPVWPPAD